MYIVAMKQGDAEVILTDADGRNLEAVLKDALLIPSYPQDIFAVKAATSNGAEVKFSQDQSELLYENSTKFIINEHERLYYLQTVQPNGCSSSSSNDKLTLSCSIYEWHKIMGHCNYVDLSKLESVVDGMQVVGEK